MDKEIQSLLKAHLHKAREKLDTAAILLKDKKFDDVVSRAYYAAFHAAQALLLTEGLTANTHQGLVNLFGLHFAKMGKVDKKYGKYLSNLKDDREDGDYEVYSAIDAEAAQIAVQKAKEFVEAMAQYLKRFL